VVAALTQSHAFMILGTASCCPRWPGPQGAANEHGAYSRHNQKYDETGAGVWYIEEQFYGILYIQAGLAFNKYSEALRIGMRIFDVFRQQKEDGSFDCPDVYHSAGASSWKASRGALLLPGVRPGGVYQEWTERPRPSRRWQPGSCGQT